MKYLNDVSYKDCVGKVCKSKSSGDFKVLKYNNAKEVEIQFLKTGYETTVELGNIKGKPEHLGCFKTEIEAFNAYKQAKEAFVKELANKWKSQIDPRAYNALMNYEVNIDD